MKKMFWSYHPLSKDDTKSLWEKALFVFDANVLVSLTTRETTARGKFMEALNKLKGEDKDKCRVWIPYHVALEYHLNRFNRTGQNPELLEKISEKINGLNPPADNLQNLVSNNFIGLKNTIGEDSYNNLKEKAASIIASKDKFKNLLKDIEKEISKIPTEKDPVSDELDQIFSGHIGSPPKDQEEINSWIDAGNKRYKYNIPPGYCDAKEKTGHHNDNDLSYPRALGDFILWQQIIAHVKKKKIKHVVFVTDDKKDDWWLNPKTKNSLPRPELRQEIKKETGVELFWMYSADHFIENAAKFLGIEDVTDEVIQEFKDASTQTINVSGINPSSFGASGFTRVLRAIDIEKATLEYLASVFWVSDDKPPPHVLMNSANYSIFMSRDEKIFYAIMVYCMDLSAMPIEELPFYIDQSLRQVETDMVGTRDLFICIFVCPQIALFPSLLSYLVSKCNIIPTSYNPRCHSLHFGEVTESGSFSGNGIVKGIAFHKDLTRHQLQGEGPVFFHLTAR